MAAAARGAAAQHAQAAQAHESATHTAALLGAGASTHSGAELDAPSVLQGADTQGYLEKRGTKCGTLLDSVFGGYAWRRRLVVVRAGMLFRYAGEQDAAPLGVPVALGQADIARVSDEDALWVPSAETATSPGYSPRDPAVGSCFTVAGGGRSAVYRAPSAARADEWVRRLRAAQGRAVRARLGHEPLAGADVVVAVRAEGAIAEAEAAAARTAAVSGPDAASQAGAEYAAASGAALW